MMPSPEIPLELLLMIAHHMRDDQGELRYGDFNAFLQVNRALYDCLNRMLWKEAAEHKFGTQRVLTHLIESNNPVSLEFFLELGAVDLEVRLPAIDISRLEDDCDQFGRFDCEIEPIPLLIVTDLDNVPLARLLLKKGAKIEYVDQDGIGKFSPIHAARSAEMVQLLLDYDADPDMDDESERRPLHWYAIRDEITAMRAILQHGAETNQDGPLEKPLHEAASRNLNTVELLVEYGADVDVRDLDGNTPLHLAASEGKIDVVKFLVERWSEGVREKSELQATPLHLAAGVGAIDVVKFLVEQWPEGMREKDNCFNTPLHLAALGGFTEVVKLLVDGWPEPVREKNNFGDTPLHLAAMHTSRAAEPDWEVVWFLAERWPEGIQTLNNAGKKPSWWFEEDSRRTGSDEESDDEKEMAVCMYISAADPN
jgi:ankyrin repeat protein